MSTRFAWTLLACGPRGAIARQATRATRTTAIAQPAFGAACVARSSVHAVRRYGTGHSSTGAPAAGGRGENRTGATYAASALTDRQYDAMADATMDQLVQFLEDVGDRIEIEDFDVEYSQGVLTLTIGGTGTYVINKQPPNKQIWLSSPVSGPERYDFDLAKDTWFCRHTDESLGTLLARELSQALGVQTAAPTK